MSRNNTNSETIRDSILGIDFASVFTKEQTIRDSILGIDFASVFTKEQTIRDSILGIDFASVFTKEQTIRDSILGIDFASVFTKEQTIRDSILGIDFASVFTKEQTIRDSILADLATPRLGGHGLGLDCYRTSLEGLVTGTTDVPTPAALASGRRAPTAPAKLSIVPKPAPTDPGAGTVTGRRDVIVPDGSASEEPTSTVEFALDLPDHLQILLVTYTLENHISIPHFLQEILAAFFKVDPTRPPPKERHLKLVK